MRYLYEMRLYGVLYHEYATNANNAKEKLAVRLAKRYKPAARGLKAELKRHIKIVKKQKA